MRPMASDVPSLQSQSTLTGLRQRSLPPTTDLTARAEAVTARFNSWRFKREQPDTPASLVTAVAKAVARAEPVPFVLYWGKGPRDFAADPERDTLAFLAAMTANIAACYKPGARVTLILTDTHARLNGHTEPSIARYFDEVRCAASVHGFGTTLLSGVVAANADVNAPDVETLEQAATGQPLDKALLQSLIASATKWHRGGLSPETAARVYFAQNMVERRAVEVAFPDAIFVTYNGRDVRALFPEQMPIFFMYATKRGSAVKPWFMAAEPLSHDER